MNIFHPRYLLPLVLVILFVGFVISACAQTNLAQTNAISVADSIQVTSASGAFVALLHFCGFSARDIALIMILVKLGASYYRDNLLKNKTTDSANLAERVIAKVAARSLPKTNPTQTPPTNP